MIIIISWKIFASKCARCIVHIIFSTILWLRWAVAPMTMSTSHWLHTLTLAFALSFADRVLPMCWCILFLVICSVCAACLFATSFSSFFFCCVKTIGQAEYYISHLNGRNIFMFSTGSKMIFSPYVLIRVLLIIACGIVVCCMRLCETLKCL